MRLASTLLSAVLLSCLFIQVYAVDPGEIAVPSMSRPNMNMPEPLITRPNMEAPVPNPKPPIGLNNNPNQATNKNANATSNQTQVVTKTQQEVEPMDVSGKWSIRFDDRTDVVLDLTLWSSGGSKIMGYGTLTEKGAMDSMTAIGSFAAQELKLTAKSAAPEFANQKFDEYYLDLFMANNTLSGTYVLESGGQSLGNGNVTAVRL
jgi:hypothetical protein